MKAMILAAGHGLRMLPLTYLVPKPAIPVLGRAIIAQILSRLLLQGVDAAVVNLHHLPGTLRTLLGDGAPDPVLPAISFTEEPAILGTGGGIRNAADRLRGSGPILVHNADFLSDIDVAAALAFHSASGHLATLVVMDPVAGYSSVLVDDSQRVVSLAGLPEPAPGANASPRHFTGMHIIEEALLDRLQDDTPLDIVRDVYRDLAARGEIGAYVHRGYWWEFGNPQRYLEGSLRLIGMPWAERSRIAPHDLVHRVSNAMVAKGAGAEISVRATLRGRVALGFASHVDVGCEIADSVVMPETWVAPGCRLSRVIVGPGTELPSGFESNDSLVCNDPGPTVRLPPATERIGGVLVRRLETVLA